MKEFYVTNNRFKFIALLLMIIFLIFMLVLFLKAEEISKDPCSICAERMGEEVTCYLGNLHRIYSPDNSIVEGVG